MRRLRVLPVMPRGDRWMLAYIVTWLAALFLLTPLGGAWVEVISGSFFVIGFATTVAAWRAAEHETDVSLARALRLMAIAHALIVVNGIVWTYWAAVFGDTYPELVSRVSDLAYVPVLCLAFSRFPTDPSFRWRDPRALVDGALFAVGAVILSWHFAFVPMLEGGRSPGSAIVEALEWLGTLFGSFALLRARDEHVRRIVGFALAAHMTYIVSDYFWALVAPVYRPGHWVDAIWFVAWVLRWQAARAALRPAVPAAAPITRAYRGSLAPSLFVASAYALLLVAFAIEDGRRTIDVALAAALMTMLLIVRQWLTLRENAGLADATARQAAVFRTLVASASDLVLLVRDDRTVAYASPSALRVLGTVEGLPFSALLHAADRSGALDWLEERASSLGMRAYRCRLRGPEGTWRDIELRAQDRREDPAIEGFVLNARDVSHETALEQALGHSRKLAMLSEMAGRIAHSFNNTLAALQVHAEVLVRDLADDSVAREDARAISAAAERGAGITRQLLGFSGRHVIRPVALRPAQVLESLRPTLVQLLGPSRRCAILVDAPDATVLLDRAQLEQVLVNLVANARDALGHSGTVTIRVRQQPTMAAGDARVVIEVEDTGAGIPEEVLPRVFEPFFSTKAPGRGTGLGLAMVASIVRRAGGAVELSSQVGVGTVVRILLPAQASSDAAEIARPAEEPVAPVAARVLLVDDDSLVRRASARMLLRAGYAVVEAEDGARALAIAEDASQRIDLLLTDLMMPGISGREVIARFRILRPGVPIICVTGYATEREDDKALAVQVRAIIGKPFTSAALQQAIADALRSVSSGG